MCTHTRQCSSPRTSHEIASSKSRAVTGSMVKVASAREVAPGDVGRPRVLGGALDPRRERAPQAAIEHQRLDDVARDVGAPEHARDLVAPALGVGMQQSQAPGARVARALDRRAPAALEERLADEEAAALLEQDDARRGVGQDGHVAPATAIARSSPSSGRVFGSSLARHVGDDPLAGGDALAAEVAALGREVLPGGDVQRAAVGELEDLLEDALAERLGADDLRAVAVLQRAGDDLRGRGGVAVDQHRRSAPWARPDRRWRAASAP